MGKIYLGVTYKPVDLKLQYGPKFGNKLWTPTLVASVCYDKKDVGGIWYSITFEFIVNDDLVNSSLVMHTLFWLSLLELIDCFIFLNIIN